MLTSCLLWQHFLFLFMYLFLYFIYFFFTSSTLHNLFTVTILSKNVSILMDFLQSVCSVSRVRVVCKLEHLEVVVYVRMFMCVCYIKAVSFSCADVRGRAV